MSISYVKTILENISTCEAWSLQILKIHHTKRDGSSYLSREINISPTGRLSEHINKLANKYLHDEKNGLEQYTDCREYDGSSDAQVIYKLNCTNNLIDDNYQNLIESISNPDSEINPLELNAHASVIKGSVLVENTEVPVKFISMQNPVTTLKNKFFQANGTFTEITDKVLSLRNSIDVLIADNKIYMLNLAGENLFNMEKSYKKICYNKVALIKEANIIHGFENFEPIATCGHNPRKFVSFNDSHLNKLKDTNSRKIIAQKFGISLVNDLLNAKEDDATNKIVKLLCQRGMLDPFDDNPMEVSGSKKWI